jgi:hypothetical protein
MRGHLLIITTSICHFMAFALNAETDSTIFVNKHGTPLPALQMINTENIKAGGGFMHTPVVPKHQAHHRQPGSQRSPHFGREPRAPSEDSVFFQLLPPPREKSHLMQ